MKTQELKEIIRSVIKEELQKTLPTLIPNILSEILTGQSKPVVSEKLETPKVSQKPYENIQPAKKTFKKYTNNDALTLYGSNVTKVGSGTSRAVPGIEITNQTNSINVYASNI